MQKYGVFWFSAMSLALSLAPVYTLTAQAADDSSNGGTQVYISIDNNDLPASDLFSPTVPGKILDPDEARAIKRSGTPLSLLEPDNTSDVFKGVPSVGDSAVDEALPVQDDESVEYTGSILSSAGRYRFNVQTLAKDGLAPQSLTFLISQELHTVLLRKELLRRLGYRIPGMKYLKRVRVRFPDAATLKAVLELQIFDAVSAAAQRWIVPATPGQDPLVVVFQDLVATETTPNFNNLAMGPPIERLGGTRIILAQTARILRALALPYGLANVPENVNQLNWYFGRIEREQVTFEVPDQANFGCTWDDALWMYARILKLKRSDFEELAIGAHYPEPVRLALVERLIARRNSMIALFKQNDRPIGINKKLTVPEKSKNPIVKNGKILQKDWPGYASRFAYSDPESPLHGLKFYLLSEVESNFVANLVIQAQQELPQIKIDDQFKKHSAELEKKALTEYFKTGHIQKIEFGAWAAPFATGGVDISRNVVIGSYLGTNNPVQLADTYGYHADAGIVVGLDGLPAPVGFQGKISGSASISVTHLKPLRTLEMAVKEPVRNEFVPFVFQRAASITQALSDLEKPSPLTNEQIQNKIAEELKLLRGYLDVGESLIRTETLNGETSAQISIQASSLLYPRLRVEGAKKELVLSRVHVYRKDANTIQVFKDNGELTGLSLAYELSLGFEANAVATLPILSVSAQRVSGSASSQIYTVNISPNTQDNPTLFKQAAGVAAALRSGSVEGLAAQLAPKKAPTVYVQFEDSTGSRQWFDDVHRTLRTNGRVHVRNSDGAEHDYLSFSDGQQAGKHFQKLATQVATYAVERLTHTALAVIDTQAQPDPGASYLGHSRTRQAEFQSQLDGDRISKPFVRIDYRWTGWNINAQNASDLLKKINQDFAYEIFPEYFLGDAQSIKLYRVSSTLNIYAKALNYLLALKREDELALEKKYNGIHHCGSIGNHISPSAACHALHRFDGAFQKIREGSLKAIERARAMYDVASSLEEFATFPDFLSLVGGKENIYLASVVNGFRLGAQEPNKLPNYLSTPLPGKALGKPHPVDPNGVLDSVQAILGINRGEFEMKWIRDTL